jgi:hypothetical protein
VHHNSHPSRQQLRPGPQIQNPLPRNIKSKHPAHNPPDRPRRHNLTSPRDRRRAEREVEGINLFPSDVRLVIKREVRVDVLISAIVQHQNLAEEGEHGHVLGDVADEDAAAAVFPVVGIGLVVQGDQVEEVVEGGGHAEGLEEDEGGGGGELQDYELGGGAEAGVEGANVGLVG